MEELWIESLDGSWGFPAADWVQIGHHVSKLECWESLLLLPGCTLGKLWSSIIALGGHLVLLWVPWASKMDAVGSQADIAKTIENHEFCYGFGRLEGDLGACRSSGLSCWHTGWQLTGWLDGSWMAGWTLAGPVGRQRDPRIQTTSPGSGFASHSGALQ